MKKDIVELGNVKKMATQMIKRLKYLTNKKKQDWGGGERDGAFFVGNQWGETLLLPAAATSHWKLGAAQ